MPTQFNYTLQKCNKVGSLNKYVLTQTCLFSLLRQKQPMIISSFLSVMKFKLSLLALLWAYWLTLHGFCTWTIAWTCYLHKHQTLLSLFFPVRSYFPLTFHLCLAMNFFKCSVLIMEDLRRSFSFSSLGYKAEERERVQTPL